MGTVRKRPQGKSSKRNLTHQMWYVGEAAFCLAKDPVKRLTGIAQKIFSRL
jgi:hypothetical protein